MTATYTLHGQGSVATNQLKATVSYMAKGTPLPTDPLLLLISLVTHGDTPPTGVVDSASWAMSPSSHTFRPNSGSASFEMDLMNASNFRSDPAAQYDIWAILETVSEAGTQTTLAQKMLASWTHP
jgi:hypothetical protein